MSLCQDRLATCSQHTPMAVNDSQVTARALACDPSTTHSCPPTQSTGNMRPSYMCSPCPMTDMHKGPSIQRAES